MCVENAEWKKRNFFARVARSPKMWVNAAKERKLGHAQLYWCVYGGFSLITSINSVGLLRLLLCGNRLGMGRDGDEVLFSLGRRFFPCAVGSTDDALSRGLNSDVLELSDFISLHFNLTRPATELTFVYNQSAHSLTRKKFRSSSYTFKQSAYRNIFFASLTN